MSNFFRYLLFGKGSSSSASRSELETQTLPYTFTSNSHTLRNYRIYGNTETSEGLLVNGVGDLVTDSSSPHYGEYCIPVTVNQQTTNIYLPQPLYKTQNGMADMIDRRTCTMTKKNAQIVITSANISNIKLESTHNFYLDVAIDNVGPQLVLSNRLPSTTMGSAQSQNLDSNIWISASKKLNIWIATIEHTIEAFRQWIEETPLVVVYKLTHTEEVRQELPPIMITAGECELSVGTDLSPSKFYLQGNISEISVSAQSLQRNLQELQTADIDDGEISADVMPIKKPDLQLDGISEISLETVGGDENAE